MGTAGRLIRVSGLSAVETVASPIPVLRRARAARAPPQGTNGESLDFAILRGSYSGGNGTLGFDPRKSPERIAKELRVSPGTVRRRLGVWRDRGFLRGFDVIPNPGLLGGRFVTRVLDFQGMVAQERAIEALSLIDGMIQIIPARTMLLAFYFVDSASQSDRRLKQIESVEGTESVHPEVPYEFPPCSRRMSRSDWQLLLALRRDPEGSLRELAQRVGQSTRTTSRRYDSLLDESAMIFDPIFDFTRYYQTLANLVVCVDSTQPRDEIEREIRALCPQSIPTLGSPLRDAKGGEAATVIAWVAAPTSAELDAVAAHLARVPGVSQVNLWFPRTTLPIRPWLDERIETVLRLGAAER